MAAGLAHGMQDVIACDEARCLAPGPSRAASTFNRHLEQQEFDGPVGRDQVARGGLWPVAAVIGQMVSWGISDMRETDRRMVGGVISVNVSAYRHVKRLL